MSCTTRFEGHLVISHTNIHLQALKKTFCNIFFSYYYYYLFLYSLLGSNPFANKIK